MREPSPHEHGATVTETHISKAEDRFRLLVESVSEYAIFLLDPEGRIASWNQGAERLKGWTAREIVGRHFSTFYPAEAVASGWPERELQFARSEGRFSDEGWRLRKDGSRFWAYVVITALRGDDGKLRGYAKVTRDLTDRKLYEETLRRSEERFRLLVDGVKDYGIFSLDPDGLVSSWNSGAARILGYTAPEILGRSAEIFLPAGSGGAHVAHVLTEAREFGRHAEEGWRVRKNGERFFAHAVITALYDPHGGVHGFATVVRDLTDRRRIESLEEQRRQLSEFLAMLAHELRNPLAPVRNTVALLRTYAPGDARLSRATEIIDRQVAQLTRLVDDLLDVSRITLGKITLRKEPHDLRALVDCAVEACRSAFDARNQRLGVHPSTRPVLIDGDATRLTQVVVNLLQNAAKYTPVQGAVDVTTAIEGGEAVLRVRDDGIGISADLLPRVFDLFTQGERTLDRSEGGLGVGLALVQRLVALHGGSVAARSDGAGRGSEFIVRLPLLASQAGTDRSGGPSARSPPARTPRRILVVDDNPDALASMEMLLRAFGHDVRTAADGPEALRVAESFLPEVALLDIGLPHMDGYEVAKRLKTVPALGGTLLVAITGYGQEEDRRRTREAGFAHHLTKPVDPMFLSQLIDTASFSDAN